MSNLSNISLYNNNMRRVVIIDTSVFCCWLNVAGKETAGSGAKKLDRNRIDDLIQREIVDRKSNLGSADGYPN